MESHCILRISLANCANSFQLGFSEGLARSSSVRSYEWVIANAEGFTYVKIFFLMKMQKAESSFAIG